MIRRAIIGLAIFTASISTAEAATISQVFTVEADAVGGNAVTTVAFDAFDPSLGELESAVVSVDIEGTSTGTLINRGDREELFGPRQQFVVGLDGGTVFDSDDNSIVGAQSIGPGGAIFLDLRPQLFRFENIVTPGSSLFSALSDGGTLDLSLGFPESFFDSPLQVLTPLSAFTGTVQVDFNFAEAPDVAPVPLPASALFLLAGIGAMVLPRLGRGRRN